MTIPIKVSEHVDNTRGSGYTTAQAFQACAYAICNPGVWVTVEDHSKRRLMDKALVRLIVKLLDVQGIPFQIEWDTEDKLPCFRVYKHGVQETTYVKR